MIKKKWLPHHFLINSLDISFYVSTNKYWIFFANIKQLHLIGDEIPITQQSLGICSQTYPFYLCSFRLLKKLEDIKTEVDVFWGRHEKRLKQALLLRKFEEEFKLVGRSGCVTMTTGHR